MADTSQSEQTPPTEPQTNGVSDGIDDDERNKMRPADIDADMKEMERRKRVEMIMNSRLFREELERIIETQLKDGNGPAGLLQQLSDMMGLHGTRLQSGNVFRGSNCVIPINDIRGVESMGYAKGEKILRCKLAAVYRLMDLCGWTQGVYNHITARLNQDQEHFLINPFGMLYHEITASSLVKIDMQGSIVEPGTTNFNVNVPGFMLHSAIHAARPDIKCIIHVHTPTVLAVSSLKCGLLPLCQEAVVIGEVSNHPYLGAIFEPEEREKIARNLGPVNKVMFLSNHGAVCCGETIEEAFFNVYNTVLACETQVKIMPVGVENLVMISDEVRKQVYEAARRPPDTLERQVTSSDIPPTAHKKEKQWRLGNTEFEALMRMLDNAGFRTGYIYRHPLVKGDPPRPRNDVEVPPAVSSLGYLLEEEEMYKQGQWKKYMGKTHDRTRWLNSPNVYQKVEILETGTPDPKKITKWVDANAEEWVAEGSPTHSSTPVKIESALQFVPKNTDPKEFKKLQQQIKDNRRADKITSGPQSHILEGVSWEEAKKLQDANISATGDQVILVGAASKGIIQRGFQHNALVYKTPYAKNPFDTITDEELEEYKKVVERKQRGESFDEDQTESEPLSSSLQNSRPTNEDSMQATKSPLMSPTSAASETEEESRDEPRVLRIETKQVPRPSQAEVVLSDAESDLPDPNVERSLSLRLPAKVADSSEVPNEFKRSWSLGPNKQNTKDIYGGNYKETDSEKRAIVYNLTNAVQSVTAHYSIIARRMHPVLVATTLTNFINEESHIRATGYQVCCNNAVDNNSSLVTSPRPICNITKLPLNCSKKSFDNTQCNHHSVRMCESNKVDRPTSINCCSHSNPEKLFSLCMEELKGRFISKNDETEIRLGDEAHNNGWTFGSDDSDLSSSSFSLRDYDQQYSSCESLNSFFIEGDISSNISDDSLDKTSLDENFEEMGKLEFTDVVTRNTNLSSNLPSQELCVFNPKHYVLCYSTSDSDTSNEMHESLDVDHVDTSEVTNALNHSSYSTWQISKLHHSWSKGREKLILPTSLAIDSSRNSTSTIQDSHSYDHLKNNKAQNKGCEILLEMPILLETGDSEFVNTSLENNKTIPNENDCTKERAEIKYNKCYFQRNYNITEFDPHPSSGQLIQANEATNELPEIDTYFWDTKYKFALISVETEYVSKDKDDFSCDKCIVLKVPDGIVKHLQSDCGTSLFHSQGKQNLRNHENQRNKLVGGSKNNSIQQIHRSSNLPAESKILPRIKLHNELPAIDTYFFSNKYCFKISSDLDCNDQLVVTEFTPLCTLEAQKGIIESDGKQSSSELLDSYVEKFNQIIENICSNFL